ncbi:MAG TPA: hypothetical protein EYP14_03800, partial [Planctomycetaceae bacterium]|nr:hypothetical protein [Planctomycetaceae bacterium]
MKCRETLSGRPAGRLILILAALLAHGAAGPLSAWAAGKGAFRAAVESIRRGDLRRHAAFLASDDLEGREAGAA